MNAFSSLTNRIFFATALLAVLSTSVAIYFVNRAVTRQAEGDLARGLEEAARLVEEYRSILFDKTPGENWPVLWHQDLSIALSERVEVEGYGPWSIKDGVPHASAPTALLESMITLRLHLDDTGVDNGALCVVPGSHRQGRISADEIIALSANGGEICVCRAGEILKMSPLLLHSSRRSQRLEHRRILHFEYAPQHGLDPRLKWNEGGLRDFVV